jgi:hypothetical protein
MAFKSGDVVVLRLPNAAREEPEAYVPKCLCSFGIPFLDREFVL